MKRELLAVATAVLMLGMTLPMAAGGSSPADVETPTSQEETDYVVGFHELPEDRDTYQGEPVIDTDERLKFFVVRTDDPATFKTKAKTDRDVRYIHEDHNDYELQYTPNDPRLSDQYGPQITETKAAWDTTLGSTAVTVGLLDTGINAGHEDFDSSVVEGYDYVNGDSTFDDAKQCDYHGSHTSGTAAALTDNGVGIAGMSNSAIDMHKIFDKGGFFGCGAATSSDIADALSDHADEGAHISSNSWGGGNDQVILDAIDYAVNNGVVLVAAAGNDGSCTNCVSDPWKSRPAKTIIVSCTDSSDNFCSFSSQGDEVDVAAPGNSVLSVDGGGGYKNLDGTSMSTPHVAGAVGLYIDANGDASHSTIQDKVYKTADDVGLTENEQGGGRLSASDLLASG